MARFDELSLQEVMDSCLRGELFGIKDTSFRLFIKEKSDNFDLLALKLIITDIRNYVYHLQHCLSGDEKRYGIFDEEIDVTASETYGYSMIAFINFDPEIKLPQRIESLPSHNIVIPNFKGLEQLKHFSNLAEELYVYENNKPVLNSVSPPVVNTIVPLKLHSLLSTECLLAILDELIINKNLILNTESVKDDWLYWFDRKNDLPNPKKILWPKKHTILPNFIVHICDTWILEAIKNAFDTKTFSNPKEGDYIYKSLYNTIERIKKQFE